MHAWKSLALFAPALLLLACSSEPAPEAEPLPESESEPAAMNPAAPESASVLRGEVFYLDRRALSEQAVLILELTDTTGPYRLDISQALEGQQVPIPFEMPVSDSLDPSTPLRLRAAIVEPGGALRIGSSEDEFTLSESSVSGRLRLGFAGEDDFDERYVCGERSVNTLAIGGRLIVVIDEEVALLDRVVSASGERYGNDRLEFWLHQEQARLTLDGETQPECRPVATPSADALAGTAWRITEIAGEAPVAESEPEIEFLAEEARMAGTVGCNRFGGEYFIDGQSLRFGTLMNTLMACPDEALNDQEQRALEALSAVDRFEVMDEELRLFGGDDLLFRARARAD
ncbi:hypothetical protein AY599_05425 [Leptolyngbya valderiana BDU 20041]|nr:hypothetical protein AY599_05425 [Leptolyngbya valderiana BDU 20041]